ncbi:hypothetical protein HELRODRAFT_117113 [Helobdella robusta]|uniref:FERM domain-containing protein n=1 Tax=Helobdella robusta TaxID=6412 RepID=T1EGK2_HELRO|nr:hypothetical protein HELRODRAFT_117113 [Helobdella robusta]ESO09745.1 hypothetical protein HELRODRAFT_117113 [Helobdella robusta]
MCVVNYYQKKTLGKEIVDGICLYLNITEADYFGCSYYENDYKFWLIPDKPVCKQITGENVYLEFGVKYYVADPLSIEDDVARSFLFLQVRKDIKSGRLPCSFVTLALLNSYFVQAYFGDYDDRYEFDVGYVREYLIDDRPTDEMIVKVVELHKTHVGVSRLEAEKKFLDSAKGLTMYGVHMHNAFDMNVGRNVIIGICGRGVTIYDEKLRINDYPWQNTKLFWHSQDQFVLQITRQITESKDSKVVFRLPSKKHAKKLFKLTVDHHYYFRSVWLAGYLFS